MPAKRCSFCALDWPLSFKKCAKCEGAHGPLDEIEQSQAMSVTEARSLAKHFAFERFYDSETQEQRDARRAKQAAAEGVSEATDIP